MKEQRYIIVVEMPDGSTKEFMSYEVYEVGSSISGGKVTACRKLKRRCNYSSASVD